MAIVWGSWKSGSDGWQFRVGIDLVSMSTTGIQTTYNVDYYLGNNGGVADSQTLTMTGAITGSVNYYANHSGAQTTKIATRTITIPAGASRTFGASISGIYNGAAPSVSWTYTQPPWVPNAPNAPTVTNLASSGQNASWDASVAAPGNNGAAITRYRWQWATNSSFTTGTGTTHSTDTSRSFVGFNPNTTYWLRVQAYNSAGWGQYGASRQFTTPQGSPAAPTNLSVSRVSDSSQSLSWTRNNTSAAPYGAIEVQRRTTGGNYARIATLAGTATFYTDTSTAAGNRYDYRVRATNGGGNSSYSNEVGVSTTPAAPKNVTATKGDDGVLVTWDAGSTQWGIYEYEVQDNPGGTGWVTIDSTAGLSYTHTGANPLVTHQYRVLVKVYLYASGVGTRPSAWSTPSAVVQLAAPPAAPVITVPAVFDPAQPLTITWAHNPTDSSAQRQYQLQRRLVGGSTWTNVATVASKNQFHVIGSGLVAGSNYEFQVRTWGQHVTPSPYSAVGVGQARTTPTVAILAPGGTLTGPTVTVEWGFYQAQGGTQAQWEARLVQAGRTLETRTGQGAATSTTFTTPAPDGASLQVQVRVRSSHGLWSEWVSSSAFNVSYKSPVAPVVTLTEDRDRAGLEVGIWNPPPATAPDYSVTNLFQNSDLGRPEQVADFIIDQNLVTHPGTIHAPDYVTTIDTDARPRPIGHTHRVVGPVTELARNHIPDPNMTSTGAPQWRLQGGVTLAVGGTLTIPASHGGSLPVVSSVGVLVPATAGEAWSGSVQVDALSAGTYRIDLLFRNGVTVTGQIQGAVITGNGVYTVTGIAPADTDRVQWYLYAAGTGPDRTLSISEPTLSKTAEPISFFSGDTPDAGGLVYTWDGPPNNAPSVVTGPVPVSMVGEDILVGGTTGGVVTANTVYTHGVTVRTLNHGLAAVVGVRYLNAAGGVISAHYADPVPVPVGDWSRPHYTHTTPTGANRAQIVVRFTRTSGGPEDEVVWVGDPKTTAGSNPTLYMDGDWSPYPAVESEWEATPGESASLIIGNRPHNFGPPAGGGVSVGDGNGLLFYPYGAGSWQPVGGSDTTGSTANIFAANPGPVTFAATIRQDAPTDAVVRLEIVYNTAPGWAGATVVQGDQAGGLVGDYDLRVNATLPTGVSWVIARVTSTGTDPVRVVTATAVADAYDGPPFSGSSPKRTTPDGWAITYIWTATESHSVSVALYEPAPAVTHNQVFRRIGDNGEWVLIADDVPVDGTVLDRLPALNRATTYRVVAWTADPTSAPSEDTPHEYVDPGWLYVNYGDGFVDFVRFYGNVKPGGTTSRVKALHRFAGRRRPVAFFGEHGDQLVQIAGRLTDDSSDLDALERMFREAEVVCYRDSTGRRIFGTLGDLTHQWVTGKVVDVSFDVTEVDHAE